MSESKSLVSEESVQAMQHQRRRIYVYLSLLSLAFGALVIGFVAAYLRESCGCATFGLCEELIGVFGLATLVLLVCDGMLFRRILSLEGRVTDLIHIVVFQGLWLVVAWFFFFRNIRWSTWGG